MKALEDQQVSAGYIQVLRNLYIGQTAKVKTDKLSRSFRIQRGTKQGDPLSSLLLNAILEKVMRQAKQTFQTKTYGIKFGNSPETRLTNLRFADDVLLTGRSLNQVREMLSIVQIEAQKCGLELHPEKTKMISSTNKNGRPVAKHAKIGGMKIQILPLQESLKYLGCQISFGEMQDIELRHRIRGGWAKFMEHKQELTGKHYSLNSRLKLFDAIITPTILYGSECWTVTRHLEDVLRTTQRKMLRLILGRGRRRVQAQNQDDESSGGDVQSNASEKDIPETQDSESEQNELEPWVDWIRRVTHEAEATLKRLNIKTWVEQARTRKWRWAANVLCRHGEERWARVAFHWDPRMHYDAPRPSARRKAGGPRKRWHDEIEKFWTDTRHYTSAPHQKHLWDESEEQFVLRM